MTAVLRVLCGLLHFSQLAPLSLLRALIQRLLETCLASWRVDVGAEIHGCRPRLGSVRARCNPEIKSTTPRRFARGPSLFPSGPTRRKSLWRHHGQDAPD